MSLIITQEFSVPGVRYKRLVGKGPRVVTISLGFIKIIYLDKFANEWLIGCMKDSFIHANLY